MMTLHDNLRCGNLSQNEDRVCDPLTANLFDLTVITIDNEPLELRRLGTIPLFDLLWLKRAFDRNT